MKPLSFWHRSARRALDKGIKAAFGSDYSLDSLPILDSAGVAKLLKFCDAHYPFPRRDGLFVRAWLKERSLLLIRIKGAKNETTS